MGFAHRRDVLAMAHKDHPYKVRVADGRAPASREDADPLWSDAESQDLFDPDRALEAIRARAREGVGDSANEADASRDLKTPTADSIDGPGGSVRGAEEERTGADDEDEILVPILDDADEAANVDTDYEATPVDPKDPRFETADDPRIPPGRASFRIGEASRIVGVRPHVLRYWESELEFVRPEKTETGQRRFGREDLALLLKVRRLRHDANLTMAQTRTLIREAKVAPARHEASPGAPRVLRDADAKSRLREHLLHMREAVLDLLQAVDGEEEHDG
ncbi:MAG: MerR family transcriptional regulator [Myxococcales bacterium]|nr:MerR family transcriptional regulator [Myxococcales bacterium]